MADEPDSITDMVMKIRNKENWVRYDSICIGPGSTKEDTGWFENWSDFSAVKKIKLFERGRPTANSALCNTTDREDWAQLIYGMWIEWLAPVSDLRRLTEAFDFDFASWWTTEVVRTTFVTVTLANQDTVLQIPASFAPAGHGTTELRVDGAAAPTINPGVSGVASVGQAYLWPTPLGVPATKRVGVQLEFDSRIFGALAGLTNAPGSTVYATPDPLNPLNTILRTIRNRFIIRVGLFGPRFAQLRGAYSQGSS